MASPRRFDHDEAARLHATGEWTQAQLAEKYGVTPGAIFQMLVRRDPKHKARMNERSRLYQWEQKRKPCLGGCGEFVWTSDGKRSGYCRRCLSERQYGDGVREDALLCRSCGEWKPDWRFVRKPQPLRRGRGSHCRDCQSKQRQAYRDRRRVPCTNCGGLRSHSDERGGKSRQNTGLCAECFTNSQHFAAIQEKGRKARAA